MKINIKTVMTVCLLMVSTIALAVPAQRVRKTITLADGTKKEVTLVGDENMHFYVDADENVYVMATDGKEKSAVLWKTSGRSDWHAETSIVWNEQRHAA